MIVSGTISGTPILVGGAETKGQLYDNRDGVFVREFTNGWAIYNRSGKEQQIEFTGSTTSVSSGIKGHAHTLADLDGEIYLKADEIVDIKEDGVVDIDVTNIEDATEWVPDANLRMAVTEQLREKVALPEGVPLRKDQMRLLRNLSIDGLKISDLTGLEHAVFLQHLDASGNEITDLQPLANLVHLNSITLNENQISDISPLANLLSLASLNLSKNIISDITPLKHLTKLIKLSLADNLIEDITIVANLENLLELRLNGNLITDISPILNLPALEALNIKGNPVKNISPLFALDLVEFEYDEEQLEAEPSADVNGDGVVNIQDLVIVANALGKAEPDLNGDGVVNIHDLIIVANAFE